MSSHEVQSIVTIALLAAFGGDHTAETEPEAIRRMAGSLDNDAGDAGLVKLYPQVLIQRVSLDDAPGGAATKDAGKLPAMVRGA